MNTETPVVLASLAQCSVLLGLAWVAHAWLRGRHPRSRLLLWRGVLCVVFLVPISRLAHITILRVPVYRAAAVEALLFGEAPEETCSLSVPANQLPTKPTLPPIAQATPSISPYLAPSQLSQPFPWMKVLLITWGAGAGIAGARLLRLQLQLNQLRAKSTPASPVLQERARAIQSALGVRRPTVLLISDSISSSFVCGLLKPSLLLPKSLLEKVPDDELSVLLAHELAHFRGHDLVWCVAWRWVQAIFWFHPMIWGVPSAHNLACEQEADRIASDQLKNRPSYAQLLARLALRVLAMPEVETRLALNGTSQIARRLKHLEQPVSERWGWPQFTAGTVLFAMAFLIVTGSQLSKADAATTTGAATVEFKKVLVVVKDQDGNPISGASIKPTGFRVKGRHGADAYPWQMNQSGPAETAVTDDKGQAYLKYPVMGIPEEKELTGALILMVTHSEHATVNVQDFAVDGTDNPIKMTRGIVLEVSGYFGPDHQPVADLIANLNEQTVHVTTEDWQKQPNGSLSFHRLSPGGHLLQLMGRLPSGEVIYSDTLAFSADSSQSYHFALEMKPGTRLEGRLDDRVPRPVRNARVMIDVRPKEYPALLEIEDFYDLDKKYGGREFWHSYRPIAEDGTFVFESLPPGEADIVVLGEGFASKSMGMLHNHVQGAVKENSGMAIPQPCPLVGPITKVEIATEPTATLELTTVTKSGAPIEDVWVGLFPVAFRMRGMFGWNKVSSEEPFRQISPLPDLKFSGQTDKNGKLVLPNIPAEVHGLDVSHSQFQVPLQEPNGWRDRHLRVTYSPGQTNSSKIVMEPIGSSFIGAKN